MAVNNYSYRKVSELTGLHIETISGYLNGRIKGSVDTLVIMANTFGCNLSSLVDFDIEVRDIYKDKIPGHQHCDNPVIDYSPLRYLIYDYYKDKQEKKTIQDFFDKVKGVEISEERKEHLKKIRNNDNEGSGRFVRPGLSSRVRAKIGKNEPVSMEIIYNMCNVLKCSIDNIVTWKEKV